MFAGTETPVWITPKFSIPISSDQVNLGAGALIGTVLGEEGTGFGIAYGSATFGDRNTNVTFGLGYGYAGGDFANAPTINVAAMIRTGPRGYILTENYYIGSGGENALLLSFGGRRIIRNAGIDFGGIVPVASGTSFIVIPWLGVTFGFGEVYGTKDR